MAVGDQVQDGVVRELLGLGSRSRLFRAERGGRDVVLKVFEGADPSLAERLRDEVKALGRIEHPNLVGGYELVEAPGIVGLWLDFVPHPTLAESLGGDALPVDGVQLLGRQLVDAVAALHAAGVVHDDLISWNVWIGKGQLWLGGLGDAAPPEPGRARSPDSEHDPLSNVFSLGVLLYELACGATPFGGPPHEVALAMAQRRFRRPREVRPDLPASIDRAIVAALEPDRRYRVPHVSKLRAIWMGLPVVWDPPPSLPMLFDTPVPMPRAEPPPAAAGASPPATLGLPTAATVPPAGTASSPVVARAAPTPAGAPSMSAPVFVPAATRSSRGLFVGAGAVIGACLALACGLGLAGGLFSRDEPPIRATPASLASLPRTPAAEVPVAAPPPLGGPVAPAEPVAPPGPPAAPAPVTRDAPVPAVSQPLPTNAARESWTPRSRPPNPVAVAEPLPEPAPVQPAEPAASAPEGTTAGGDGPAKASAPSEAGPAPAPEAPARPGGPQVVHRSELEIKVPPRPVFPFSERGSEGATCLATVTVSERGVPTAVTVKNCSAAFAESTEAAMMKARFAPPVIDGQRVAVITTLPVKFARE